MTSNQRVYSIIGGASGMGLATAQTLLKSGHQIAVGDINQKSLDAFVQSLSADEKDRVLAAVVNVTDKDAVKDFLGKSRQKYGKLDGVANFAGVPGHELGTEGVWETTPEEYNHIMDCNVRGPYNVLNESLKPGFLEKGASVVHVGSMFSLQGFKNGAVFAASKHAALGMVKSAAKEVGQRDIRVNCVLPGVIDTPMHRANLERVKDFTPTATTPIPRDGTAQEVANAVIFLLSPESSFVTGTALSVDGGANA
uniref:ARAD1B01848p n=1 Tax=Blastobotrys adeninivorans TaxID=409370 RepID=A0A060TAN5_BLAAD